MDFLSNLERACALGRGFLALVVAMMIATLVLRRVHLGARTRLRVATLFQLAGIVGLVVAATMLTGGVDPASFVFGVVRDGSDILLASSIVTIFGVILFDFVLEPLKLRPPPILTDLILAAGYVAAMILVLGHLGRNLSSVLTTSAIATAAIGFSLQDTLRSVMGGMSMQMDRTVRAGDWIRIDGFEGRVAEIRWRQTSVETRDGDTVVIPNSYMAATPVTIIGKRGDAPRRSRRSIRFQIDHDVSTGRVIEAVEVALKSNPVFGMALSPEPDCVLVDLRDAWQTLAARYWVEDFAGEAAVDSVARMRIIAALKRIGVGFSYPTQSLLLHPRSESDLERSRQDEARAKRDALARVPIFAPLTDEEHEALAAKLVYTPFSAGETITRQGASANWLYVVLRGSAAVHVATEAGGAERRVALLGPGDFFGEMALLTGAPRSATVVAVSEVVAYKLDKDSFLETIQARPSMAEEISRLLAQRRVELDAAREGLNEEARRQRLTSAQKDLLSRIREFFRLY